MGTGKGVVSGRVVSGRGCRKGVGVGKGVVLGRGVSGRVVSGWGGGGGVSGRVMSGRGGVRKGWVSGRGVSGGGGAIGQYLPSLAAKPTEGKLC